ncbi:MAG: TetR/AcrR family transcriptional regulator [Dehalococcoidales bacterium]|nr:TetR/AcrR family transcriptional regulator [Dehalococcoidales bacterium]
MSELRKKQKQKREDSIIGAARMLIGEKGYRNTSIDEIAEKAEVGPATVYNYFSSKASLFLYIFHKEVEKLLTNGQKILSNPPAEAQEALFKLAEAYFADFISRNSRRLVREIFIGALVEQLSVRKEIIGSDYILMEQFVELLKIIKGRGQIRHDLDVTDAAFVIYSLVMTDLLMFFMDDDMPVQDCLQAMRYHITLVFSGFT